MKKRCVMKGLLAACCALGFVFAANAWAKDARCVQRCNQEYQICKDRCKGDTGCLRSCNTKSYSCENNCK